VLPPIGAQGLNLGLMDAAVLAEVLATARRAGGDVGAPAALADYHRARAGDVESRARAVDALSFTLTSNILPLELARGFGLHMLAALKPLRQTLMHRGLEPAGPRPSLMQPSVFWDGTAVARLAKDAAVVGRVSESVTRRAARDWRITLR
jgi:2-octaprenyl-6-methoxyphenol hydroxylase